MSEVVSLILAAGKGTRMKSAIPKVLHKVGGQPMIQHVLNVAKDIGAKRNIAIIGFGSEAVQEYLKEQAEYVVQKEQLGTGHAVMQAKSVLSDFTGTVLVLCGDVPLLESTEIGYMLKLHHLNGATGTILTAIVPDPTGYGRIIRNANNEIIKIVEQKDASIQELSVNEINTGIYCFQSQELLKALDSITCKNSQGEYYLTDVIDIFVKQNKTVLAAPVKDYRYTMGINSRVQLAEAEVLMRQRKLNELMISGVTVMDPGSTFIDNNVSIGTDTVIYPFTWLEGNTVIGNECSIGPNVRLTNTVIGDHAVVHFTYGHDCILENDVTVGPYVHLRPNTVLHTGVKVGNFVEIKNSLIGKNSKVPHLSYVGDTDMGSGVNIGSGTITVNYDGKNKHRTNIEDDAFIGCNANLIAPVTVGKGAYVAAGSTITKNIPPSALGVARARQSNFEGWAEKRTKD